MSQNTDTKRYWNLTKNIYRFAYEEMGGKDLNGIHTVDERIVSGSDMSSEQQVDRLVCQGIHRAGPMVHELHREC